MKKLTLIAFITWSILLVLILSFGTGVAGKIATYVSHAIHDEKTKIKDISFERTTYIMGVEERLDVILSPDTYDLNDLVFTSSEPDVFLVTNHFVESQYFEEDKKEGTLVITSKKNKNFKKEVELTFIKTYPDSYDFSLTDSKKVKLETNDVSINVPFYLCGNLNSSYQEITEDKLTLNYDHNFFELIKQDEYDFRLLPKYQDYQVGDDFEKVESTIEVLLNDKIVETFKININPTQKVTSFDSIKLYNSSHKTISLNNQLLVNETIYLNLFENDKELITDYLVTSSNQDVIKIENNRVLKPVNPGSTTIKVELDNGYYQEYDLQVKNNIVKPTMLGVTLNTDKQIEIKQEGTLVINLTFSKKASFTSWTLTGDNVVKSYDPNNNQIVLYGDKVGTQEFSIIFDDGLTEPVVYNYQVKILDNKNTYTNINQSFSKILAKILGHMAFFALEAFLAFYVIYLYKIKRNILVTIGYFSIGLFLGGLTEFIQMFMPGRTPAFKDILIDYSGYLIGLLFAFILLKIILKIKKKEAQTNE